MMNKKIYTTLILIFVFIGTGFCDTLKILSFNLNGNYKGHRLEVSELWADDIITIIKQSEADIVLLQEVYIDLIKRSDTPYFKNPKPNNVLDYFVRKLSGYSGTWKYLTSAGYMLRKDMTVDGSKYISGNKTQNNAVLFNSNKLEGIDQAKMLGFDQFTGSYLFDKNSVQVIEFTDINKNSKFVVINVHLPYNNWENAERDLNTLEKLYSLFKLKTGVIIGGDFNTQRQFLTKRNFDNVDGTKSWYYDKNFGLPTTISTTDEESFKFYNDYDHFIFNNKIKEETIMQRLGIPVDDMSFYAIRIGNNNFYNSKDFFDRISDHYPIIFEFSVE
ncbi:hypothetical protein E4O04_01425 [Treponema sp. OMZ 799]|uniref:endonuclease/exonuclease/phosphatase family protein n=1 Tax=Treponema sp. OMZ 799 TaxID=2563668 RepID=UPI0020A329A0|nr:endonuclease/exonuclease/phosphatase family protein [Treponema sp. OMZ 799]UTC76745.1 hypothetical protein E4O04_01425 [Treponema sp. OMZ 799]